MGIKELNKIKDDEKFLKQTFLFVAKRYDAMNAIPFILNLPHLFQQDPNKIIETYGPAYCHIQGLILRTILLKSNRFKPEQIKKKISFFGFVIHQYTQIKIKNKTLNLDPWAYDIGVPYGSHGNLIYRIKYLLGAIKPPR